MKNLWENFTYSIKYQNRFFPNDTIIINELNRILDKLIVFSTGTSLGEFTVYRSRVGRFSDEKDIRKPKPHYVLSDGRCNPKGISYFYSSSNIETAIHEVKANINDVVTVGTFKTTENLQVSDFRSVEILEEEFAVGKNLMNKNERELLNIILEELKKPINSSQTLDYIPIQYIVEYIKQKTTFDGFSFDSSFGSGKNFVFFDDEKFKLIEPLEHYSICQTNCFYEKA